MTWKQYWAAEIDGVHETLPEDATLEDREEAIKHLAPQSTDPATHKRAWQAARREYLQPYGYVSKAKPKRKAET